MKKFLFIALILSLILVVLNYFFQISFNSEIIDSSLLFGFLILLIIHLTYPFPKIWMKIAISSITLIIIIAGWFYWEIFGYDSSIQETWDYKKYKVTLENRVELTGPGNYWIIAHKKIGSNLMFKKIYEKKIENKKIDNGEKIQLIIETDTIKFSCCTNNIIDKT